MSTGSANPVVAIDSMALVWGIRKQGTRQQLERARWLFEKLDADQAQIILPCVCVAEYLSHIPAANHAAVIAALNKRFLLIPFDVKAASLAAQIFADGLDVRPKGKPGGRAVLRADSLIIATAVSYKATAFYTGDAECLKLAKKWTNAMDLPTMANSLFDQTNASPNASPPPS